MSAAAAAPVRRPRWIGVALVVPYAALVLAGIWVASRLSGSYLRAIVAVAVWIVVSALIAGKVVKTYAPAARWPVRLTSLAIALGLVGWVAYSSLHTTVAHERVAVGVPISDVGRHAAVRIHRLPVQLLAGRFGELAEGSAAGRAAVVRLPNGSRVLTFTRFAVSNGPDLRVYLITADQEGRGSVSDPQDLGALKGSRGNQQYAIPRGLDLHRYSRVLVYCRSFNVGFAGATLRPS